MYQNRSIILNQAKQSSGSIVTLIQAGSLLVGELKVRLFQKAVHKCICAGAIFLNKDSLQKGIELFYPNRNLFSQIVRLCVLNSKTAVRTLPSAYRILLESCRIIRLARGPLVEDQPTLCRTLPTCSLTLRANSRLRV